MSQERNLKRAGFTRDRAKGLVHQNRAGVKSQAEIGIGYDELASTELDAWDTGAEESVTFTYWQAIVAPGEEISAPAEGTVQLVAVQPDTPSSAELTISPEGAARNDGTTPVSVYGVTLAP